MSETTPKPELLRLVAVIVAAHARHNQVDPSELPDVIRSVYSALSSLTLGPRADPAPVSAVPVKHSVYPDYIVCLEDGKKLKMLKRYLRTYFGMTPEEYRVKWNLPDSYPMVAPNHSATRSRLAKQRRFGHRTVKPDAAPTGEVTIQRIPAGVSGKRIYRKRKTAG